MCKLDAMIRVGLGEPFHRKKVMLQCWHIPHALQCDPGAYPVVVVSQVHITDAMDRQQAVVSDSNAGLVIRKCDVIVHIESLLRVKG